MCSDPELETFADSVVTSWGTVSYGVDQLAAQIEALYRYRLRFPPAWPQHRREAFITTHADAAATQLATLLDDLIDAALDEYGRENRCLPDAATARHLIHNAQRAALMDIGSNTPDDLLAHIAHDASTHAGTL
jgi:hypothetical protein